MDAEEREDDSPRTQLIKANIRVVGPGWGPGRRAAGTGAGLPPRPAAGVMPRQRTGPTGHICCRMHLHSPACPLGSFRFASPASGHLNTLLPAPNSGGKHPHPGMHRRPAARRHRRQQPLRVSRRAAGECRRVRQADDELPGACMHVLGQQVALAPPANGCQLASSPPAPACRLLDAQWPLPSLGPAAPPCPVHTSPSLTLLPPPRAAAALGQVGGRNSRPLSLHPPLAGHL